MSLKVWRKTRIWPFKKGLYQPEYTDKNGTFKFVKRRTSWLRSNTFGTFFLNMNYYANDRGYLRSSLIGKCNCSGSLSLFKSSSTCARLSLRALYRFTSRPTLCACLWKPNKVWRSETSGKMYSCKIKIEKKKSLLIRIQYVN